ncbi:MAG: prepilin-type N-terminal cleavage/methylation domain-containing protein [Planctomycetes bacterium]|nr:prepilin-type N-terminal cleavage/methylation domain-containing protein [Planctomycetota bacterium]
MSASRRTAQGGFTLLEMMLVSVLMVVVFSTLALGLRAGHGANREIERKTAQTLVGEDVIDRLFRISLLMAGATQLEFEIGTNGRVVITLAATGARDGVAPDTVVQQLSIPTSF